MSLSICDYCGGHIPLGPEATNQCDGCGRIMYCREPLTPVAGIDDSELVALRAERDALKKENEALKKRERDRWASAASAFDRYSTISDQWMNLPMNVDDFGTRRPGDF